MKTRFLRTCLSHHVPKPHLQPPPLTMSNDRRMNLTVGDYERPGCPDLPEGIMPKDQRREWLLGR